MTARKRVWWCAGFRFEKYRNGSYWEATNAQPGVRVLLDQNAATYRTTAHFFLELDDGTEMEVSGCGKDRASAFLDVLQAARKLGRRLR